MNFIGLYRYRNLEQPDCASGLELKVGDTNNSLYVTTFYGEYNSVTALFKANENGRKEVRNTIMALENWLEVYGGADKNFRDERIIDAIGFLQKCGLDTTSVTMSFTFQMGKDEKGETK